jgi:hypothetical protein
MAGVTIASSGETGRRPATTRLVALARAVERTRVRRRWDVRQLMLLVGAVLMAVGFLAIALGWWGAANSTYVFQEIPYLISGGLLGVAMVAGGGFLFFAAWLVRMIEENRAASARLTQTLDRVDRALLSLAPDSFPRPPAPEATNGPDAGSPEARSAGSEGAQSPAGGWA